MKDILRVPMFALMLFCLAAIFCVTLYILVARYPKFGVTLEKIFVVIFFLTFTGITAMPFPKLHPSVLYNFNTTPPTIIGQIAIYSAMILMLFPRLTKTIHKIVYLVIKWISGDPFLGLFLLMVTLSGLWSQTPEITLRAVCALWQITLVSIYVGKQYSWSEIYGLLRWLSAILALWGVVKTNPAADGCWRGVVGHKNPFSFQMANTASLWILYAFKEKKYRYFSLFITLIALVGLQKGCSGASRILTVVLISLWSYLALLKKLPVKWAFVCFILFLVTSIGISILVLNNLEAIVVDGLQKDMTLTGRTDFWPLIIDRINQNNPLFGYGMAGFWQPWRGLDNPAYGIVVVKTGFVPPHSHNGFIDLLCELGWVGLLLFILSFFNNIFRGIKYLVKESFPESALPLYLLTFMLMTNLTETGLFGIGTCWCWYVVLSVKLSLDTTDKDHKK
ncbi:O-antigen ligase family protein [Tychonema sp. LEGE 07199]|uniref:O-antigen ligase family protein n=1 Tax=unclassified Tychonema TaxID=2642144 RepID=UPI00187E1B34|nr:MULTISPECIES: O-antigen ligase family protein [unclassified Tychonema]MBE9121270.1 O-antigen ligase family protein [Tychonema sp. LEGE 07199]MBE9131222.1 O-antigen ligase family protein [Tychonema sp. LEGE 07196]